MQHSYRRARILLSPRASEVLAKLMIKRNNRRGKPLRLSPLLAMFPYPHGGLDKHRFFFPDLRCAPISGYPRSFFIKMNQSQIVTKLVKRGLEIARSGL